MPPLKGNSTATSEEMISHEQIPRVKKKTQSIEKNEASTISRRRKPFINDDSCPNILKQQHSVDQEAVFSNEDDLPTI